MPDLSDTVNGQFSRWTWVNAVCEQLHVGTTDWIFVKILPELYVLTRKSKRNFRSHPDMDVDAGIF